MATEDCSGTSLQPDEAITEVDLLIGDKLLSVIVRGADREDIRVV